MQLLSFIKGINPRDYYTAMLPGVQWNGNDNDDVRAMCPFHKDTAPSFYVNPVSGKWYCHGCKAGGNSILTFHKKIEDIDNTTAAARDLFHRFVHPTIDQTIILSFRKQLFNTPTARKYLESTRFISPAVTDRYELGFNGTRITIPIRNENGFCVNMKAYDPLSKQRSRPGKPCPKMISYKDFDHPEVKYGRPTMLYPLQLLDLTEDKTIPIFVCEGEFDTLALISLGLIAVTSTNGSKSWPKQYNAMFRSRVVYICYDNDKDGCEFDRKVVLRNIGKLAREVRRIDIPKSIHGRICKDVTDWLTLVPSMRSSTQWLALGAESPLFVDNPHIDDKGEIVSIPVPLDRASQSQWFTKLITVPALITGKDTSPYLLPSIARCRCAGTCDDCPMIRQGKEYIDVNIDPKTDIFVKMIDEREAIVRKILLTKAGINPAGECCGDIEILKTFNVEQLILIPTLDEVASQYVVRQAYFVGHGLKSNHAYNFLGTTIPHPRDQHAVHIFHEATPLQSEIDSFTLTPNMRRSLRSFQVNFDAGFNMLSHLMDIAEWKSRHITNIRERPDLHIAIDLAYHSVAAFKFNGELVKRGMLDILVLGDTRCGKGYVAEGLRKYYGLGEIGSGECCTFAGLIGGVQQHVKRFFITWGLIPLNNGRLVIIDEASSLSEQEISRMSRVRSEGVAEITKIVRESTNASTRLIWLSNPRTGRRMETYDEGVLAVKELFGANEDVSRLDFAITVATAEVPPEVINTPAHNSDADKERFPPEVCRALVLWAWSRTIDQVQFTDQASSAIIQYSLLLGRTFSPNIPLIQSENVRIKLAKISAAAAAMVYSTDDGVVLIVKKHHVYFAYQFLRMIYEKRSMGYDTYSRKVTRATTIQSYQPLDDVLDGLGHLQAGAIEGIIQISRITRDSLADFVGDPLVAQNLIGELVRYNCLSRIEPGGWYLKNPAFNTWIKHRRKEIARGKAFD